MTAGTRCAPALPWGIALAVSAGGLGYLRPASGSWGSLPPVGVVLLCVACGAESWMITVSLLLLVAFGSIACVRFGRAAEEAFGAKDPSTVVADEVAGCALTLAIIPWWIVAPLGAESLGTAAVACAGGFFWFRLFDVWKPGFVRTLQDRPHGWGILLDDLGAAVFAWIPVIVGLAVALGSAPPVAAP